MRVWQRWVLVGGLVGVVGIVVATLGSKRTDHSPVTVSFMGYTNLPGGSQPGFSFLVRNERPASVQVGRLCIEVGESGGHKARSILVPNRVIVVHEPGGGVSYSLPVDEVFEITRWRAVWISHYRGFRFRLLCYAQVHHLPPRTWLYSQMVTEMVRSLSTGFTNTSIWITNPPLPQMQPKPLALLTVPLPHFPPPLAPIFLDEFRQRTYSPSVANPNPWLENYVPGSVDARGFCAML